MTVLVQEPFLRAEFTYDCHDGFHFKRKLSAIHPPKSFNCTVMKLKKDRAIVKYPDGSIKRVKCKHIKEFYYD